MVTTSKVQHEAIIKMEVGTWYSAYDLQTSISTLNALVRKGILRSRSDLGSSFSPRISILFKLK